ncbi:MAG: nucleotidyltransferase family protein [Alphaproteobacteria bacterium]
MPSRIIDKAFILAAGLGTRMRPLTDSIPKPLAEITGNTLLSRTLDHLKTADIKECVINTHHLAEKIPQHLGTRTTPKITYSHEPVLLDTGGGIKKMLHFFKENPFYVLSGDGLWTNKANKNTLSQMNAEWDDTKMDILILLQPVETMILTKGVGDYDITPDGRARRSKNKSGTHMFTSMRINHPRIFDNTPDNAFSYLQLLDKAEEQGKLYAMEHEGDWHHLSTLNDLNAVNAAFAKTPNTP